MNKNLWWKWFVILVVMLVTFACGSSNEGEKIEKSSDTPTQTSPQKPTTYNVGDSVKMKDQIITLNSAHVENGVLSLNFTVENIGNEELIVSSVLNFSARLDDGTILGRDLFNCGTPMDGKVLAGDKLRGDICYPGIDSSPIKVYYEANLLGSGAVVWEINN